MESGILTDTAELAGVIAEGPLLGIFLVLDIAAIYILVGRRRHSRLNIPMVLVAVVMMGLALAQFIVDSANVFMGFIPLERAARLTFFADITEPIFAAKHAIYFTMLFVGDMIVIYRCYIIWSSNIWVVVIPTLCSLASAASAYQTIWAVRHPPKVFTIGFSVLEHNMGFAVFALSFSANIIATGLISYKIWKADRDLKRTMISVTSLRTDRVLITRIILESGALNTAYLLIYTVVLKNGTRGIQVVACIVTPLVGIIFTTVIIRVALAAEIQARITLDGGRLPGPQIAVNRHVSTTRDFTFTASEGGIELAQKHPGHLYKTESI